MIAIWTNHLSVANRAIDSAHKRILNMINIVDSLIGTRDYAALSETFRQLETSLCDYFETEEKIAKAINVEFDQHRLAHLQLLDDLHRIRNLLEETNGKLSGNEMGIIAFPWGKHFIRHIQDDEKEMKVVLSTQYYDFQPD